VAVIAGSFPGFARLGLEALAVVVSQAYSCTVNARVTAADESVDVIVAAIKRSSTCSHYRSLRAMNLPVAPVTSRVPYHHTSAVPQ